MLPHCTLLLMMKDGAWIALVWHLKTNIGVVCMSYRHSKFPRRAKLDLTLRSEASCLLRIREIMLFQPPNILSMYKTRESTGVSTTLSIRHREIGILIIHKRSFEKRIRDKTYRNLFNSKVIHWVGADVPPCCLDLLLQFFC